MIGGPCEGCEAVFEFPDSIPLTADTLSDFNKGFDDLLLTGTVFMDDGITPARNVIIYMYHTNEQGIYLSADGAEGWARRHGRLRSWVKTGPDGIYSFFTSRPGIYQSRSEPAHIHFTIAEPDGSYYWINSSYFDDDLLLGDKQKNPVHLRGGPGNILHLIRKDSISIGSRDIILRSGLSP